MRCYLTRKSRAPSARFPFGSRLDLVVCEAQGQETLPFQNWMQGCGMLFHNNTIGNFMVHQHRIETNSLQLSHTEKIQNFLKLR